MRTGLKILARKIIKDLLNKGMAQDKFPEEPISEIQLRAHLLGVKNDLKHNNICYNLGSLCTNPHPYLAKVYGSFLKYNSNHLGNWSIKAPKYNTQQLEYEAIQKIIDLYNAKKEDLEGYITSGGTESNIYSLWTGRSYLSQFCKKEQIALLCTNLTHYSIRKAGNICDTPRYFVPLNPTTWGMDRNGLQELVKRLYGQGMRGFLLPLTIGYTSTGTQDNIPEIIQTVEILEQEYLGTHFYIWIDAALNGLIEPFLNESFTPFSSPLIKTIVVDFHKFGLVPYSAGIVLYRRQLRELIEQPIDYLHVLDNTLLGSRPGASATSIWAAIHLFGKKGYAQLIKDQMQNKQYFIEELGKRFPMAELINNNNSLSCGVIFHSLMDDRLPRIIEDKYWLYPARTKLLFYPKKEVELLIYKFFFLPHIKRKTVKEFFSDCKHA
jgi:tyrosine decarboxylase/aspartate 1-decarboxylase